MEPGMSRCYFLKSVKSLPAAHADQRDGVADMFPAPRDSTAIVVDKLRTLIQTVLKGARKPATAAKPAGLAMPGFENHLDNAEVAAMLTHVRNSWGNHAPAVPVADLRKQLQRSPP